MPALIATIKHKLCLRKQRGAALMVMLVIFVIGSVAFLTSELSHTGLQIERDKITADALAQAKEGLIGYALSVDLTLGSSKRPGDLPCPDTDNDGVAETLCGNAAGSTGQTLRLGRLPWKTLGLPDIRDSSGERLWYATSNNFKNNTRTTCTNSNLSGCLNSDTLGTITLFSSDGTLLNDGGANTGVVAVIIAPGEVLQRQGGTQQDRSSAGSNTASNYLDIVTIGGNTVDNADFTDGSSTDGFIQGRVLDSNGKAILNDQILAITPSQFLPLLEKRVAAEVKNCLSEYAAITQNNHYYPWATTRTAGASVVYNDSDQLEFGHIPDAPFEQTCNDTGGSNCNSTQMGGMMNNWGPVCNLANNNWWVNWKEMVFYGFAHSLRPHNMSHSHTCPGSTCIAVNPPSATVDKSFVVLVAGKKISPQVRATNADKNNFLNYLEGQNADGVTPFEKNLLSTSFNDTALFE